MVEFKFRLSETKLEDGGSDLMLEIDPIDESKCSTVESLIGLCLTNTLVNKIKAIEETIKNNKGDDIIKEVEKITKEIEQ